MTHLDPLHIEKAFYELFPERFAALHDDPQLCRVYDRFGIDVFRRSCVLEGLNAFLQATGFKGRRCVEIGTCNALTTLVLARYFDEVVSIDIAPNAVKHQIVAHVSMAHRIRLIDVKDNSEKAQVIRALDFDAAFSDGDHARDTDSDFALVERCGQVLMHEHWSPQPAVVALVSRLRARGTVDTQGKWALWRRA